MNVTCNKREYLLVQKEIYELAREILSDPEMKEADEISEDLSTPKKRKSARQKLIQLMMFGPKRPMYYLRGELRDLPRWTRDAMRYLGDYIDHLAKYFSADINKNESLKEKSLGRNLNALKGKIPENISSFLERFNELLYVPAKHDMKVINRKHRFTCKEVVYSCYMTKKLSEILTKLSPAAKLFSEGKINV